MMRWHFDLSLENEQLRRGIIESHLTGVETFSNGEINGVTIPPNMHEMACMRQGMR